MSRVLSTLFLSLVLGIVPTVLSWKNTSDKIYGLNLGSWLLAEPWMFPEEWKAMGGESCNDCSQCIASEYAFAKAYPDTVDQIFEKHWETWFTQDDVDKIASYGMNHVRLPLGYWIVEPLVNRSSEYYAKGGIKQLKRGLKQLKEAGINVILDHHALPGVSTPNQMFAGNCTSDAQFYTDYNYHRALIWTAVMTAMSHLDSDFGSVIGIEAMNEPIMDASKTPGLGDFQKNFVRVVRAVEALLGIGDLDQTTCASANLYSSVLSSTQNATQSIHDGQACEEVGKVLLDAAPMLAQITIEHGFDSILFGGSCSSTEPLNTVQMDVSWQYNNPSNPADAAIGPQLYDNHLYYAYGGVADANETAYLKSICNLQRVENDAKLGNSPLFFGEWSLATQWDPTDSFMKKWADAQKLAYSKGAGWMFWNFKTEVSQSAGTTPRYWSYYETIERGYMTKDPSQLNDPHVCDDYVTTTNGTATNGTATNGTATNGTVTNGTVTNGTATNRTTSNDTASNKTTSRSVLRVKRHIRAQHKSYF